jgi:ubiquinone/menaquinone biosynthesis C-methylase UbiE
MRALPFPDASFDAVVSAYAIDHLGRDDIPKALAEAARVLKPDGQFLLEVMNPDWWMKFTWGPVVLHGASADRMRARWTGLVGQAGFRVQEVGTQPVTLYLLAVKR